MNEAVSGQPTALHKATGLWFLVTLLGLSVFLYRIVAQYGVATLLGHFEDWERNNQLYAGYVAGDRIGNLAFAVHVTLAAVVTVGGMLQLIPQIRERAMALHRWNGRAFMLAALVAALTGIYMNWVRHANSGPVNSIGVTLNGVLILACVAMAWRTVRAGDIDGHRRWALRAFIVANGVFFKRLLSFGWSPLTSGAELPGLEFFFEFGSYLLPLGILELYLRARASRTTATQLAAVVVLLAVTLYMCVGTVAFAMWVLRKNG